jgi:hypothetical protein
VASRPADFSQLCVDGWKIQNAARRSLLFSGRRDASPPRQAGRLTLQLWAAIRLDENSPVSFLKGMKAAGDGKTNQSPRLK